MDKSREGEYGRYISYYITYMDNKVNQLMLIHLFSVEISDKEANVIALNEKDS
jgi:hypothetical protein